MLETIFMFVMLGMAIIWWLWGSLRHDLVAMILLFILVLGGLIPSSQAFIGFSHPAVIMLVAMMIISRSFQESGIFDFLGNILDHMGTDPINLLLVLALISALSSAFLSSYITVMLLMPIALQLTAKRGIHASMVLLPEPVAPVMAKMPFWIYSGLLRSIVCSPLRELRLANLIFIIFISSAHSAFKSASLYSCSI